jgi:hypothetical protein
MFLHHSIALEMLNLKSFKSDSIRVIVYPQIPPEVAPSCDFGRLKFKSSVLGIQQILIVFISFDSPRNDSSKIFSIRFDPGKSSAGIVRSKLGLLSKICEFFKNYFEMN